MFLFTVLQSEYFQRSIELFWSYGTQQNIGMGVISNLYAAIPNIQEQEDILDLLADELSKIEKIVDKSTSIIHKLNEYRQSLISAAVTGKIDVWGQRDLVN
jgi:type I restriction enzyme S subunit